MKRELQELLFPTVSYCGAVELGDLEQVLKECLG